MSDKSTVEVQEKPKTAVIEAKSISRREFLKRSGKATGAAVGLASLYVVPTMSSAIAQPAYAAGTAANPNPTPTPTPGSGPDPTTLQALLLASTTAWENAVRATFLAQTVLMVLTVDFERLAPTKQLSPTGTTRQDDVDTAVAVNQATQFVVANQILSTAIAAKQSIIDQLALVQAGSAHPSTLGDPLYIGSLTDPSTWTLRDFDGDGLLSQADVDLWSQLITAWGG